MKEAPANLETAVKDRFAALARDPSQEHRFPIGPDSAKRLGYSAKEINSLPGGATESFAGVGNPFSLGDLRSGQSVLDLGCGAGMDSILAAQRVGPTGTVIGIDMVDEMLAKARRNTVAVAVANVHFRVGHADALPVPAESIDVVITNGVFNLCADKPKVVAELFRVLRPGGRLQMADILLEPHVTPEELAGKGSWSDWVSGAIWERSLREMLLAAGFGEIGFHGWTGYRTSDCTQGALVSAVKLAK
ncbi:MAG: methyltransferase domain-containing protein [Planctomycetes bacterium]|nr:methyltransferase domain-containing protein [Planctomycetota bacterium]